PARAEAHRAGQGDPDDPPRSVRARGVPAPPAPESGPPDADGQARRVDCPGRRTAGIAGTHPPPPKFRRPGRRKRLTPARRLVTLQAIPLAPGLFRPGTPDATPTGSDEKGRATKPLRRFSERRGGFRIPSPGVVGIFPTLD